METINLFAGINRVTDFANISDLEKKHHPTIECPDKAEAGEYFKVKITVGKELAHPDENDHYIQWLELYAGDLFVSRVDFTPKLSKSPVTLGVKLEKTDKLRAIIRCNLHGLWESTKKVAV